MSALVAFQSFWVKNFRIVENKELSTKFSAIAFYLGKATLWGGVSFKIKKKKQISIYSNTGI